MSDVRKKQHSSYREDTLLKGLTPQTAHADELAVVSDRELGDADPVRQRLVAVGDIHGQRGKLTDLLNQIQPTKQDQFIFLGDYVDRGPDSKGVIEDLIDFRQLYPQAIFLRGNHDQLMLDVLFYAGLIQEQPLRLLSKQYARKMRLYPDLQCWKDNGGDTTEKSYRTQFVYEPGGVAKYVNLGDDVPFTHVDFLQKTWLYHQQGKYIFVHAGMNPQLPLSQQNPDVLLWDRDLGSGPKGKTLVIGHTPTPEGEPLIADDLIMLDTGAGWGGPLTAMDLLTGQVWQSRQGGG